MPIAAMVLILAGYHAANGIGQLYRPIPAPCALVSTRHCEAVYFRATLAFANPEMNEFLEGERAGYTIGLAASSVLHARIG